MRITNRMISSQYTRNLNKTLSNMNYLSNRVETGKKFFKGSEDTIGAIKSHQLRREYLENEQYACNISDVESTLLTAESSMTGVSKSLEDVYVSYLEGITGTTAPEDRKVIAKELRSLQDSMIYTLNAKYGEKYVFGGTGNNEAPFSINDSGNLCYKGYDVTDTSNYRVLEELSEENVFVDLGLGLNMKDNVVNSETAFDSAIPGIKILGFGETTISGKEVPNNLYVLIGKLADELENENFSMDNIKPYIENFENQKQNVLMSITELGTKTSYLEFLKIRSDDNKINLNKKIISVENVDQAEAITDFKMQQYAYNASLQMGNKLLQPSFIDYMR